LPKPLPYDIVNFDDGVGARILYEVYHILGVYGVYTTTVYGE
jgi:hypothetical protein